MLNYLKRLFQYNSWANERLYGECANLPDDARKLPRGGPFSSIHGVMNHLLLADRLWLSRIRGKEITNVAFTQDLYTDFDELRRERAKTDAELISWTASLTEEALGAPFTFTSITQKRSYTFPFEHVALHIFTHQIHHRGQLVTYMKQAGCKIPVTDLLYFS